MQDVITELWRAVQMGCMFSPFTCMNEWIAIFVSYCAIGVYIWFWLRQSPRIMLLVMVMAGRIHVLRRRKKTALTGKAAAQNEDQTNDAR